MNEPARRDGEYDVDDLRELMNNIGGWAGSWDDVLLYLEGPAERDAGFSSDRIPSLIGAIRRLQRDNTRFTRDYRKIWQRLDGGSATRMPPPAHADPHALDPFEVQTDYLAELEFPADKRELLRIARHNNAPTRVMDQIEALGDKQYRNRDELLEELNDADWCTPKPAERTRIPGGRRP